MSADHVITVVKWRH